MINLYYIFIWKNLFEGFSWYNVEDSCVVLVGWGENWFELVIECFLRCVWN